MGQGQLELAKSGSLGARGAHALALGFLAWRFSPQATLGDVWRHVWLSQLGRLGASDLFWGKVRDAAELPPKHRTAPNRK